MNSERLARGLLMLTALLVSAAEARQQRPGPASPIPQSARLERTVEADPAAGEKAVRIRNGIIRGER